MNQMMKKCAYALAGLLLAGCTGDLVKLGAGEAWGEFIATFTLQGKVMDARTGAALGGDNLKLKLIQGTEIRDPNRLIKDSNDPLMGEYAFSGIPITTQDQAYYKIVAINSGFIQFESILDFYAYYDNDFPLMDSVYNWIGDIYMQPIGATAPTYTVNVVFNGKPVPGAVVNMDPDYAATSNGTDMAWILSPYYGYTAALSATTDGNGKATFAGTSLALGVRYEVRVNPLTFENIPIVDSADGSGGRPYRTITVGVVNSSTQQVVSMSAAVPGGNQYGLYVADASNKWGNLDPSGKLTLVFSRPVTLTGNLSVKFPVANYNGGTLASAFASSTLSADGLTLTLTPNWATQPSPSTDRGAYVSFGDASVTISDYPDTSFNIFGLTLPNGVAVSRNVQITTWN
jgi:hypothetical protein